MKFKLPIFVLVFMFGLVGMASAFTLDYPATGDTIGAETIILRANSTALHNQTNITFYALCSDTANSTWVELGTNGTTGPVQNATLNWTVSDMEDSASCQFKATSGNDSTETDTNTGITIDRTVPTAPTSVDPVNLDVEKQSALTVTSTVTGTQTTSCTIAWEDKYPSGGSPDTMTHSGNTCSISYDHVLDGTYHYTITASDGTNSTSGTRTTFEIDTSGGSAVAVMAMAQSRAAEAEKEKAPMTVLLMIAVIIGVVIYSKKK